MIVLYIIYNIYIYVYIYVYVYMYFVGILYYSQEHQTHSNKTRSLLMPFPFVSCIPHFFSSFAIFPQSASTLPAPLDSHVFHASTKDLVTQRSAICRFDASFANGGNFDTGTVQPTAAVQPRNCLPAPNYPHRYEATNHQLSIGACFKSIK
jgi:hypothetical protein